MTADISDHDAKIQGICEWILNNYEDFGSWAEAEKYVYDHANDGNTSYDSAQIAAGVAMAKEIVTTRL